MILDATPLIHLVRIGYGWIFREFPSSVIPLEVYEEVVVRGAGKPDAAFTKQLITEGVLTIADPKPELVKKYAEAAAGFAYPLHRGEAAVLALAEERNDLAIIDDLPGRMVAKAFGIQTRGSLHLLLLLYGKKKLGKADLLAALDSLVETGWRLSTEDYARVRRRIGELK